jgi:hypothetical protein
MRPKNNMLVRIVDAIQSEQIVIKIGEIHPAIVFCCVVPLAMREIRQESAVCGLDTAHKSPFAISLVSARNLEEESSSSRVGV